MEMVVSVAVLVVVQVKMLLNMTLLALTSVAVLVLVLMVSVKVMVMMVGQFNFPWWSLQRNGKYSIYTLHPPRTNYLCQLDVLAGDNLEIHRETGRHRETPALLTSLRSSDRSRDPGSLGHLNNLSERNLPATPRLDWDTLVAVFVHRLVELVGTFSEALVYWRFV